LNVMLGREGAAPVKQSFGPTPAGKTLRIVLPSPVGVSHYHGQLTARFANGSGGEMPLDFDVQVFEPLRVEVDKAALDLAAGRVALTLSRPAEHCDYDVELDGKQDRHGGTAFHGEAAGTHLALELPVSADDVVLIVTLTCYDTYGTSGGVRLAPWKLDVPHEEVNFATGESRIEPSEQGKLERAYEDITTAIRRYGDRIAIRLFIVGHTDTVGDAAANDRLSLDRALAIAQYLRKRGVRVPVAYAGMGERALLVATADEAPEARNRRAQYILSVDEPFTAAWKRL
jgi:hypothetical protein